jgi:phage-related holin
MQFYSLSEEIFSLLEANRRGNLLTDTAASAIGALLYLIDEHIWSPAEGYILLVLLSGADFLTAVMLAWHNNHFETRKALRFSYKLVAYTSLLFFAHNLGKYESALAFLPHAVFMPLILMLFLSLIKNMSLLGWLPTALAEILYKKIDVYKNETIRSNEPKFPPKDDFSPK